MFHMRIYVSLPHQKVLYICVCVAAAAAAGGSFFRFFRFDSLNWIVGVSFG